MEKIKIVENLFRCMEEGDFEKAKSFLAPEFKIIGAPPQPLNADAWMQFQKKLSTGIPDFKFNFRDASESGNIVNGVCQVGGTFTHEMPAFVKGQPSVKPNNKKIQNPKENITVSFKGDKILTLTVERVPDAGIPGLLKRMGVKVPEQV